MSRQPTAAAGAIVITVEHAGRRVPARLRGLFEGPDAEALLASHRGWDPGAASTARELGRALGIRPLEQRVTRLVIDVNRSLHHRSCFSELTRGLSADERARIVAEVWRPHRAAVEDEVVRAIEARGHCLHIGVHTFTPVLGGVVRRADVGILYDPGRAGERALARAWRRVLRNAAPELRIRRNYPYRGAADGLATALRRRHGDTVYAGIELELNQALYGPAAGARARRDIVRALAGQLAPSSPPPVVSGAPGSF